MWWLLLYFVAALLFLLFALFHLHIPLPAKLADRQFFTALDILMRLFLHFPADVIDLLFGSTMRLRYFRLVIHTFLGLQKPKLPGLEVYNDSVGGVKVRIYTPHQKQSSGALIFFHGGGWVALKPELYDSLLASVVRRLGVTVISVDYRLAPEHPFPVPVDDCERVVKDLYENSAKYLSIRLSTSLDFAYLLFKNIMRSSYDAVLSPTEMARMMLHYLGMPATQRNIELLIAGQHIPKELKISEEFSDSNLNFTLQEQLHVKAAEPDEKEKIQLRAFADKGSDPDISPLFGVRNDLPPAMVISAEFDILRDEAIQYAKKLQKEKVPCEWKHYKTACHGVCSFPNSSVKNDIIADICSFLERYL